MAEKLLFQGLTSAQLARVAEIIRTRDVPANTVVIHERDYGDTLYLIDEGSVEVRIASPEGDRVVAELRAPAPGEISYEGDFFGEMCLLDLEPRCATVATRERTRLWELNRDDLYWLFGDDKELQLRILLTVGRALSRRLTVLNAGAYARSGDAPAPAGRG